MILCVGDGGLAVDSAVGAGPQRQPVSLQVAERVQAAATEGALDLRGGHHAQAARRRTRHQTVARDSTRDQPQDGFQQAARQTMPREMDQFSISRYKKGAVDTIGGLNAA